MPGMEQVEVVRDVHYERSDDLDLRMDVYLPPAPQSATRPGVALLVPGPAPAPLMESVKDTAGFVSWGRLVAASGVGAVTLFHRAPVAEHREAAADVDAAVRAVREGAGEWRLDGDRLGIMAFSGAPPYALRTALRDRPPFVRCLVAYYGVMDLRPSRDRFPPEVSDDYLAEFSPLHHLASGGGPPLFVAKAGLDAPWLNRTIDAFVAAALARGFELDLMTHPGGRHAFDLLGDDARSRRIVRATLDFLREHLLSA